VAAKKTKDTRPPPKLPEQLSLFTQLDQDRDTRLRQRLLRWHVGDTGIV
jgi:hypothetical protein